MLFSIVLDNPRRLPTGLRTLCAAVSFLLDGDSKPEEDRSLSAPPAPAMYGAYCSAVRRWSLDTRTIPDEWIARLADAIAAAIREMAPFLTNESIALFAVDCHPWHGMIGLAMRTHEEIASNPKLAEPSEMAAWRYYDFAAELTAGNAFIPLGEEMRSVYYQAEDRPKMAEAFLEACAVAATAPQVVAALTLLKREKGFRISVTHPDSNREFVVSE